jgi:hypothetical protein
MTLNTLELLKSCKYRMFLQSSWLIEFIHSLSCAECDDSLPVSGAPSTALCCVNFPSTLFHQLVFHPSSIHLAICFSVYLSAFLFPNSYKILFWGILFFPILCTCPNQSNLFRLVVSAIVGVAN